MRITKKQSITDRLAKSFIKGEGISLKSLMLDEKDDLEELLKTLSEQQNLSEEQKEQLKKIIKTGKKNTRGLRELADLQQEAFFDAREQGKGIFASLKAADKLKEDYEAATTGVRSRFGGLVTALGGPEELAQAVDFAFGKKVSKEEREELKKKFAAEKVKSKKKGKKEKISAANEKQTATKKPRGRIDPVTGQFIRTDLESQIVGKSEDPVLKAISETPKAVDALINEESLDKKIEKILESVGEKKLPLDVHDKLNIIMEAVGIDLLSDLTDLISRRGRIGRTATDLPDKSKPGETVLPDKNKPGDTPDDTKKKLGWKERLKRFGRFGRVGAVGTGAAVAAGGTALAITGGGLYAMDKSMRGKADATITKIAETGSVSDIKTMLEAGTPQQKAYKLQQVQMIAKENPEVASKLKQALGETSKSTPQTAPVPTRQTPPEPTPSTPQTLPTTTTPTTSSELPPIRVSSSMPGAMPAATETAPSADELKKYVRLKDNSINLDGLNEQMKERLAGLAKEYFSKTGQKIQINSGYRSPEEQAALFAKYGAPRAAPPGRSRHESGLAIDINSTDANKAIELGLMAKYGFVRPVRGETWHVEPVETAKRGVVPDNPFTPGKPIVAANDGKEINPGTGTKPTSVAAQPTKQAEMGAAVASATPTTAPPQTSAAAAMASTIPSAAPATSDAAMASITPPAVTATPVTTTPISGDVVARQTTEVAAAKEQMMASASPAVVPIPIGGQSQSAKPTPPNNSQPASTRDAESSFSRALAKDFAHPSAFTTIGTV